MSRARWITALTVALLWAQPVIGASALSSLGYGLPQTSFSIRAAGMGMVSVAFTDTLGLNLLFPAAWSGSPTARFGFSGDYSTVRLEDLSGSDTNDEAGFTGAGMAVPVGRDWFLGVTISPYTRMDYKWVSDGTKTWMSSTVEQSGEGGISQMLIAVSLPTISQLRIGLALRPVFGKIDRRWIENYPAQSSSVTADRPASIETSDRFNGVGWGLSCQWVKSGFWSAGLAILGPASLEVERAVKTFAAGSKQIEEEVDLPENYDLPLDITVGAAGLLGEHSAGFEIEWQGWGGVEHPAELAGSLKDALRFGVGWEWAPEYRPLDPMWRALAYRGGLYMQDHYVTNIQGNKARRIALTGGISIPYHDGKSRLDVAFEIGWMGDRDEDGVTERTIGFSLGFNHSEKWFLSRREKN
ncbi:hypothetical protein HQ587_02685 [bacterium]|nr:hypothetical protein [bacterium]